MKFSKRFPEEISLLLTDEGDSFMGYAFIGLALFFGLTKSFCGKKASYLVRNPLDAVAVNTLRMILCFVIGIITSINSFAGITDKGLILSALLCGVSTACFTVSWLFAISTNAYMVVEVFVMCGIAVPLVLCRLFYSESISPVQILAIILLIVAVYCMCTYDKREKIRISPKTFALLIFAAVSSGLSDFSQKLYVNTSSSTNISLFNLCTYLFAALVLVVAFFVFRANSKKAQKSVITTIKSSFLYILIMAVCLFLHSYFKVCSAKYLDAVFIYPLNQGLAVAFTLIMSVVIFREKINFKGIIGVILALAAAVIINLF